jgi:LPXTG-site transpeptidase (sortase) family protein
MPTRKLTSKPKVNKIKNRNRLVRLTQALSLIGISLFLFGGIWLVYQKTVLSFSSNPSTFIPKNPQAAPTSLTFDTPSLKLEIKAAEISNGIWQTFSDAASHLNLSANPGEGGNIVIYAHNKRELFGPLLWVTPKTKVTLTTADQKEFKYQVSSIQTVNPDNVDVVLPTKDEVLTLYTCTGFLDRERLIIKAYPIK